MRLGSSLLGSKGELQGLNVGAAIAVAALEELHCSFPLGVPKDFQDTGEFLIRGLYTMHLQRKVLSYRNIELLSINYPNSQNHFFCCFYCTKQQNN